MSKQRLVVMNQQRILEEQTDNGEWQAKSVNRAQGVPPGVYNLFNAKPPEKDKTYSGVIITKDSEATYQQTEQGIIKHDTAKVKSLPIGSTKTIEYGRDNTVKAVSEYQQGQSKGHKI